VSKLSRTKGAKFEREIATVLRELWPEAKRGIGQTRMGSEVPDVDGTPYWVEAKHRKVISVHEAVRQATEATDGRPIMIIHKRDHEAPLVTFTLDQALCLLRATIGKPS
jgi:Holliday junction resolvase